ncbi:RibD family protein [Lapillicoccus jejuensis]|uniref:5-amino-6-(5-phosphoribosylamino)uracil reductase n=1 Tax=Lapillicoccus jejuensis TaxID=402171 RepID=A0A542DZG2_9MICO|nr:dihydrofolate reductase family protein [Lapillicoccus jejuensis]TQJ08480.1 5-amino-6-(5-phosphoribosylamino)uracil reductase [Lapillicoccus jejuensis]
MPDRPYTVLSWAASLDGCLDDTSGRRLVLSSPEDLDRVDAVRAACDAVLVGAGTVRADDPRLQVREPRRRAARTASGRPATPHRVTVTRHADLSPTAALFAPGEGGASVYCPLAVARETRTRLAGRARVVAAGRHPSMDWVLADLAEQGVRRLLVEGGQQVHTQLLAGSLADELHVVVAPFFVAEPGAHRVVADGRLPWHRDRRADLREVRRLGDVVLLRYALSDRFDLDGPGGADR